MSNAALERESKSTRACSSSTADIHTGTHHLLIQVGELSGTDIKTHSQHCFIVTKELTEGEKKKGVKRDGTLGVMCHCNSGFHYFCSSHRHNRTSGQFTIWVGLLGSHSKKRTKQVLVLKTDRKRLYVYFSLLAGIHFCSAFFKQVV